MSRSTASTGFGGRPARASCCSCGTASRRPSRDDRPFPHVDGHGDPELSPAGPRQAEPVADRLEHEDV